MSVASPDPSGVPPGLVVYLAGGHDRTTRAFSRTLVSLADRGWLEITPEDRGASTVRIVHAPTRGELSASEELVLERVYMCSRSMPTVPLSELTNADGDAYEKWRKRFKRALNKESRAMGLTKRTMPGVLILPFAIATSAIFGALGGALDSAHRSGGESGVGFVGLMVGILVGVLLASHRLTDRGKQAVAQAEAQAQLNQPPKIGATAAATAALPLADAGTRSPATSQPVDAGAWSPTTSQPTDAGTWSPAPTMPADATPLTPAPPSPIAAERLVAKDGKPLPAGEAWSSYTGRWRVVTVGLVSNDTPVAGRPRALLSGAYTAAFFTAPAVAYGLLPLKGSASGYALAVAPATLFTLWALLRWLPAYSRRLGVTRRVVVRGQIVKRWSYDPDPEREDVTMAHCISVDDGKSDLAQSFRVKPDVYKRLHVGDTVEVDYSPRWRKMSRVRRLK